MNIDNLFSSTIKDSIMSNLNNENYVVEMLGITKRFKGIVANDNITIQLKQGEIHALLG